MNNNYQLQNNHTKPDQTREPIDFLSPVGKDRYKTMISDLQDDLTTIRNNRQTRRNYTAGAIVILLTFTSIMAWEIRPRTFNSAVNTFTKSQGIISSSESANEDTGSIHNNIAIETIIKNHDNNISLVQVSRTKSSLVKIYTTEQLRQTIASIAKPLTDDELIQLMRNNGNRVGLIQSQGKTILAGDLPEINHPGWKKTIPSSNATHIKIISTTQNILCRKHIKNQQTPPPSQPTETRNKTWS